MSNNLNNPYFIITAGPSASGKSSSINKIANYFKNNELLNKKKTNIISVDNLIEKNPYFKNEIDNYFKKYFKSKKKNIYNELLYPTQKTIKFFNKTYWTARKNTDCITGNNLNIKNKTKKENTYKPCSYIINNDILKSLKDNKNIIFETTGASFPFWIFKQYPNDLMNYNIIITWSIVDICNLYERNKSRSILNAKLFMETFADNAPRLPDIRKKYYKKNLINIINTFNELVKYYGNRSLSKIRLLLFDNRTQTTKILYDSYINSDKIGYREILKYDVNKKCDYISSHEKLPSSRKSLSPSSRKSLSPSSRKSLSPSSRKISKSKLSDQIQSSSFDNYDEIIPPKNKSLSTNQLFHPMITRSKVSYKNSREKY